MIPKVIHYCWFGHNEKPQIALKCINSWRKFLPDYEIREWNEDNFDVHIIPFVHEAYCLKKWAFVSDYARIWILYNFGGIYFDTDVELIRPLDDILKAGPYMGRELEWDSDGLLINMGLGVAALPRMRVYKDLLDIYKSKHMVQDDGVLKFTTIVAVVSDYFESKGVQEKNDIIDVEGIKIYPAEFFCPMNYGSRKIMITDMTYSIHHYEASWMTPTRLEAIEEPFWAFFHQHNRQILCRIKNIFIRCVYPLSRICHKILL